MSNEIVIKNLHVSVEEKEILKGVNLEIKEGEIIALLGPNGNGKSTLLAAIMGNPRYRVTKGEILFNGEDVLKMSVNERSTKGIFLAFQNPVEIPGVISADFYKTALNSRLESKLSLYKFYKILDEKSKEMKMPLDLVNRSLNDGFSGGEKKRNEILQMLLLNPHIALLDEIDSGLDVDAIEIVSEAIKKQFREHQTGFLVISHYARLFKLIKPTKTAVLINGKIALTGGPELFEKIDSQGYEWIKKELNIELEEENEKKRVSIGVCGTKEALKNVF